MKDNNNSDLVAQKARESFDVIKNLRKTMPKFTRADKDELERRIKEVKDQWWEDVKPYMVKGINDPPFTKEKRTPPVWKE